MTKGSLFIEMHRVDYRQMSQRGSRSSNTTGMEGGTGGRLGRLGEEVSRRRGGKLRWLDPTDPVGSSRSRQMRLEGVRSNW